MTTASVPQSFISGLDQLRRDAAAAGEAHVPRRRIFELAKEAIAATPVEIEAMLDHADFDVRTGGVCVMDFQARRRSTPDQRRQSLYELYLRCHDRIDTWDLVDRAAPHVVGGYLADKPRDPLYELAASPRWWERRTAIVATYYFIRQGDIEDTFALGGLLADDPEHFVQTAVGGWVREAGKRDPARLIAFLDTHATTAPTTMLRFAMEHLDPATKQRYRRLRQDHLHAAQPARPTRE